MTLGKPERATQNRVIALLQTLGYAYLGDWSDRTNRAVEPNLLRAWLAKRGHAPAVIDRAVDLVQREVGQSSLELYDLNRLVYERQRYGVSVKVRADAATETIPLVDWADPTANDFAVAEEVTLRLGHERRPDLVLYLNGMVIGVIELKRSAVSVGEGIRQLISNHARDFNPGFFAGAHLLLAGNDTEGLRYGTIGTPETMYLRWKEEGTETEDGYLLDRHLRRLLIPGRLIDLLRDFVLFDGGVKKLPRPHQYFGIKAAQARVMDRRGGIIWHTQGSGKSIVMVLLAKWILANRPQARVVIVMGQYDRREWGYLLI